MTPELPSAVVTAPPQGWRVWWTAARPRTLTIATTPVLLGTAIAWAEGAPHLWPAALAALACALLIQAGTNMHNDAADFERGNDTAERVGPLRVTAAGWAPPGEVRSAAFAAFVAAFALGIYLVGIGGWPILAVGLTSLAAGWAYSGGPRPISHTPLGEIFVWIFFGVNAVAGSHWLQAGRLSSAAVLGGAALGSLAAAVLMMNNYRDLAGDLKAGRRTLAAVLGPAGARRAYGAMMLAPFAVPPVLAAQGHPGALLALGALPLCLSLARRIAASEPGPGLNLLLAGTARAEFVFGLLLAIGALL
ncbi:MAG: 1,4-dihydroxy-2-naphthoate polyprenyltransferase [Rhodocyclaceae bacterium]|nr:1,4-dihydroxy-2-naphthoate polyprenyltransferase [Rhodocyclaceae bacterium]